MLILRNALVVLFALAICLTTAINAAPDRPHNVEYARSVASRIENTLLRALRREMANVGKSGLYHFGVSLHIGEPVLPGFSQVEINWIVSLAGGAQLGQLHQKNIVHDDVLRDANHPAWAWAASAAALGVARLAADDWQSATR
jgi:hypothetical protein